MSRMFIRKPLAWLIALLMLMTMLPAGIVSAEESGETPAEDEVITENEQQAQESDEREQDI